MSNKESGIAFCDSSSVGFAHQLKNNYPDIDVARFLDFVRIFVSKQMRSLNSEATESQKKAWIRNREFLVTTEIRYNLKTLVRYYRISEKKTATTHNCPHQDRILELQSRYADVFGAEPVKKIEEIDRPLRNGMTQLGQVIMLSDDVEAVRVLIEEKGASPSAKCGNQTPLELAMQLSRQKVAEYLQKLQQ